MVADVENRRSAAQIAALRAIKKTARQLGVAFARLDVGQEMPSKTGFRLRPEKGLGAG